MKCTDEKHIGFELKKTTNKLFRYIDRNTNKKTIDEITGTNSWIIGYLSHHTESDVYQRDIEKRFGITRSTASKVINLMVKKELILRQSVQHDARLKKLVLTDKAKKISQIMYESAQQTEKQMLNGFSDKEKETLLSYLERIRNNLD